MPKTATRMNPHGFVNAALAGGAVAEAFGRALDTQTEELSAVLDDLSGELQKLASNPDLSAEGRGKQRYALGLRALERVARAAGGQRPGLAQKLQDAESALPRLDAITPKERADAFSSATRAAVLAEIRAEMALRARAELPLLLKQAGEEGNALVLAAFDVLGPAERARRGIDAEAFDEALHTLAARLDPEGAARLETVRSGLAIYESNVANARTLIAQATGAGGGAGVSAEELERAIG